MPDIVFSSSIEMKGIINLASSYKERIRLHDIKKDLSGNLLDTSNISQKSTLYFASVITRKTLEGVESILYRPVNPRDISLEKAENFIPDRLCTFISWILSPKQASTNETISKFDVKEHYTSLHRYYALSLAQDMLFMKSIEEVRTPEHVGMSITCHKMTQAKIIVQMFNPPGHGIIPSNIKPTIFTHAAADNWNRATHSVTGKHLDIDTMVLVPDSSAHSEYFGDAEVVDRTGRRSVGERARRTSQILQCVQIFMEKIKDYLI